MTSKRISGWLAFAVYAGAVSFVTTPGCGSGGPDECHTASDCPDSDTGGVAVCGVGDNCLGWVHDVKDRGNSISCTTDADCTVGFWHTCKLCTTTQGVCISNQAGYDDDRCVAPYRWTDDRSCVPGACKTDGDCPAEFFCSAKGCLRRACEEDSDCGEGACISRLCTKRPGRCASIDGG